MLLDIIEVTPLEGYRLRLRFEDGTQGEVDVSRLVPFEGIFEPLRDRENFVRVHVNRDLGTICWPNGADLDPDVLYAAVTGTKINLAEHVST